MIQIVPVTTGEEATPPLVFHNSRLRRLSVA